MFFSPAPDMHGIIESRLASLELSCSTSIYLRRVFSHFYARCEGTARPDIPLSRRNWSPLRHRLPRMLSCSSSSRVGYLYVIAPWQRPFSLRLRVPRWRYRATRFLLHVSQFIRFFSSVFWFSSRCGSGDGSRAVDQLRRFVGSTCPLSFLPHGPLALCYADGQPASSRAMFGLGGAGDVSFAGRLSIAKPTGALVHRYLNGE